MKLDLQKLQSEAVTLSGRAFCSEIVVMKANGQDMTNALRDEMLQACRDGKHVELTLVIDAYQQKLGMANRNFVRIHDQDLNSFADSGKGQPFLKDHLQDDSMSVAGSIIKSNGGELPNGTFNVGLEVKLTAPWAVDLALRGLLNTVSVSWRSRSGVVKCSACDAQVFTQCSHWKGDTLSEKIVDGKKYFQRDPNGKIKCEWIYHDPEMLECSITPVPAVPSSKIDEIRASLSASGFDVSDIPQPDPKPQEIQTMKTEQEIVALEARANHQQKIIDLTLEEREFFDRLSRDASEGFLAQSRKDRQDAMTPVYTSELTGAKFYACDDKRTVDQAKMSDKTVKEMKENLAASQKATLHARAETELAHLAGTTEVRAAILSSMENIVDPATREAALKAVKEYDAKASVAFSRQGVGSGTPAATLAAEEKIQQLADKYENDNDCTAAQAYDHVMNTAEGQKLYAEAEAAKKAAQRQN